MSRQVIAFLHLSCCLVDLKQRPLSACRFWAAKAAWLGIVWRFNGRLSPLLPVESARSRDGTVAAL